ncbi:hypothetical protein ACEUZ9_001095 [Paracoccus litorisediminis]|uniref:hypothetical protein n=1 Tax=Paracoccus litorisediminis TaxID=2006130 RepID=UPI00373114FB
MAGTHEENTSDVLRLDEACSQFGWIISNLSDLHLRNIVEDDEYDEDTWLTRAVDRSDKTLLQLLMGAGFEVDSTSVSKDGFSIDRNVLSNMLEKRAMDIAAEHNESFAPLLGKAPVLATMQGNGWFEIDSAEMADCAARLSKTAIGVYWKGMRAEAEGNGGVDSHRWLMLVSNDEECLVVMAARKKGVDSIHSILADCHVSGYMNHNVYAEHAGEIEEICSHFGLMNEPNHMGRALAPRDDLDDLRM